MIYINNTGKQNQVWLPKPYDVVSGDCPDVEEAYESGYTSGYTDGLNACSGQTINNQSKVLQINAENAGLWLGETYTFMSGSTLRGNVTIEPDSGYTGLEKVQVFMWLPATEAINAGYESGVTDQKNKLASTSITQNGTYTRADGWSAVTVNVPSDFQDGYNSGYTDGLNACSGGNEDLIANLQGDYYVIPEGTTHLRDYAFYQICFSSITIPDSVTAIGTSTFYGNECLETITIPDSVTSIGVYAFGYCSNLSTITLGSGCTSLPRNVFSNTTSLTGITIPETITNIGSAAFRGCSALTHITFNSLIPPTLENISGPTASIGSTDYTFPIYVPCAVVEDYKTAFGTAYAPRITCNSGETPSGTTELEIIYETTGANQTNWLFVGTAQSDNRYFYEFYSAITMMVIDGVPVEKSPDNIHVSYPRSYDWYFYEFPTAGRHTVKYYLANNTTPARTLSDLIFADNLERLHIVEAHIGQGYQYLHLGAFQGAAELTAVTLPNTLLEIGPYTFEYSGIKEITIPDSVTALCRDDGTFPYSGYGIFQACSALTSATIGTGVTKLPISTFDGCSSLQTVTMNRTTPPELGNYCFKNCTSLAHIYVPAASVNAYKTASGWSDYASIISAKP